MPDRPAISDRPPAVAAADERPSSNGRLRTWWPVARRILTARPVRWGFAAAAAVAIGGYAVARQWANVRAALASIGILAVVAAMASVLMAMIASMQVWRLLLAATAVALVSRVLTTVGDLPAAGYARRPGNAVRR
jgi:hypothetical protein